MGNFTFVCSIILYFQYIQIPLTTNILLRSLRIPKGRQNIQNEKTQQGLMEYIWRHTFQNNGMEEILKLFHNRRHLFRKNDKEIL